MPLVHGLQGQLLAALHIDRDLEAAGVAAFVRQALQVFTDHAPRHRVYGWLTHRQHQPRAGHGAHAGTGDKTDARFGQQAHLAVEQGAVGHVRVVAGVLERARFGTLIGETAELQAHLHHLALGQGDADGIAALAEQQQACCRQAGGGGATAGGQAAAQWGRLFAGFFTHGRVSPHPAR
jgi:hypothetical protein